MSLLRPTTHDDVVPLVEVQRTGSLATLGTVFAQETHPFPAEEVTARWHEEIDDPAITTLTVEVEGRIAGFCVLRGTELLHLGVGPEDFGSGLAALVHDEALVLLRAAATAGDRLVLRVFEGNGRARAFYERLGWRPTGESTRSTFAPHPVLLRYELPGTLGR